MAQDQQHTEDPEALLSQIKSLTHDFKKSLGNTVPWDADVESQRKRIRSKIVHLLFTFPFASQSKNIDTSLWLDTTHAIIALYRQQMASLSAVPANKGAPGPRPNNGKPPVVEIRKLQQRFRSFLSAEETFWNTFIRRVVRSYGLNEAKPALIALKILRPEPATRTANIPRGHPLAPSSPASSQSQDEPQPLPPDERPKKLLLVHKVLIYLGDLARYREQYNEAGGRPKAGQHTHSAADRGKAKRSGRGGKRGTADVPLRERDYSKAAECYQQARVLVPDNGNPSNQLAVLAVWSLDPFNSSYHCYRALSVRQPFLTARENLDKSLLKALETYKKRRSARSETTDPASLTERFKEDVLYLHALWFFRPRSSSLAKHTSEILEALKKHISSRTLPSEVVMKTLVLALGALWHVRLFLRKSQNPDKKPSPTKSRQGGAKQEAEPTNSEPLVFLHVLDICKALMEVGIAEIGASENTPDQVPPDQPGQPGNDLAQNISAELRRILPSLRVAVKWTKGNIEYINNSTRQGSPSTLPGHRQTIESFWTTYSRFANKLSEAFPMERLTTMAMPLEEDTELYGFSPLKNEMFRSTSSPGEAGVQLLTGDNPGLNQVHPNEEQLMRIADLISDTKSIASSKNSPLFIQGNLFYVADGPGLPSTPQKVDKHAAGGDNLSPGVQDGPRGVHNDPAQAEPLEGDGGDGSRLFGTDSNDEERYPSPADDNDDGDSDLQRNRPSDYPDDDAATVSTRTEDDPVNLAMRVPPIEDDEDEDEDTILYPVMKNEPKTSLPPPAVAGTSSNPARIDPQASVPKRQENVPPRSFSTSTSQGPEPSDKPSVAMTAQDLLARALQGVPSATSPSLANQVKPPTITNTYQSPIQRSALIHQSPSQVRASPAVGHAPTPPLLFGSSVWAPTADASYSSRLGKYPVQLSPPHQVDDRVLQSLRPFGAEPFAQSPHSIPGSNSLPTYNAGLVAGLQSPFTSATRQVSNPVSPTFGTFNSPAFHTMGIAGQSPNLTPGRSRYPQHTLGSQSPPGGIPTSTALGNLQERRISAPHTYYEPTYQLNKGSSLHQPHLSDPFASPPFTGAPRAWG